MISFTGRLPRYPPAWTGFDRPLWAARGQPGSAVLRRLRYDGPQDQVEQQAGAAHDCEHHENHPDQRGVEVEVIGQSAAHPSDLAIGTGPVEGSCVSVDHGFAPFPPPIVNLRPRLFTRSGASGGTMVAMTSAPRSGPAAWDQMYET